MSAAMVLGIAPVVVREDREHGLVVWRGWCPCCCREVRWSVPVGTGKQIKSPLCGGCKASLAVDGRGALVTLPPRED